MQAKVLVNTLNMDHDQWLQARTQGIGGSDVSAIAGLNKWKSAVQVFLEKHKRLKKKIYKVKRHTSVMFWKK